MSSSQRTYVVATTARIGAPSQRVYGIIADYRGGHPRILPKQFTGLVVEKGGVGGGTVLRVSMRVFGHRREFRAVVTEPEPGRVLVETNVGSNGSVTSFTVDQGGNPQEAVVTIATELAARPGPLGALERFMTSKTLQRLYRQELELLNEVARSGG